MANEKNVPVSGRLADDIRFRPGETVEDNRAYGRVIDNVPDYANSEKDENGNVTRWAPRKTVGYDITFKGKDAEYAAENYRKGDPLMLVTNKSEWTRETNGKPYENVTYYVTKHTYDAHEAGTVLSREKAQDVAAEVDAEPSQAASHTMSEGYASGSADDGPASLAYGGSPTPMLHQIDGYPSHLARPDAYAPAQ